MGADISSVSIWLSSTNNKNGVKKIANDVK
jgi:hypothetical protein